MEFEIALKDRVGAFAANEMINSEAELKKFKDACKLGNYQFLVKICGKSKKFTFGDAMVTSCKIGNLKLFRALLNNINTVNYSDDEFQQCLNYACDGNFSELVKYILSSVNFEFDYHVINYKSLAVLQAIGKNARFLIFIFQSLSLVIIFCFCFCFYFWLFKKIISDLFHNSHQN